MAGMKVNTGAYLIAAAIGLAGIAFINSQNYYIVRIRAALSIEGLYIPFHPLLRIEAMWGNPVAQYKLGATYLEHGYSGAEAQQVWDDAMTWWRQSAIQGYAPAEFRVGRCYQLGYCGEKDETEAAKWFQKSAEHGYWWAQDNLSGDYHAGRGMKQDYEQAYFWRILAADTRKKVGISVHSGAMLPYSSHLTPDQENAVRKKVAEWEQTHPAPVLSDQLDPNP